MTSALAGLALSASAQSGERVTLPDFAIDRTEVTIAQFARFAAASGLVTRAERDGGGYEYVGGWQQRPGWTWRTPEGSRPATELLPAVHLTQGEAQAYCAWAGGRLPNATEWVSAAYTEQRSAPPLPWQRGRTYEYPTGDRPQGANTSEPDAWPRAAPAGATTAGVNGLWDMGANVWEWASDARGAERRTMGGSWWYGGLQMRTEVNAWKDADFTAVYIGFRCVYPKG
jgi:formylglycine-generating enzyme required for sulfatase activity